MNETWEHFRFGKEIKYLYLDAKMLTVHFVNDLGDDEVKFLTSNKEQEKEKENYTFDGEIISRTEGANMQFVIMKYVEDGET
jgi:hypothetical protein